MGILVRNITKCLLKRQFQDMSQIGKCTMVVTTENVFSEENRRRVQEKLFKTKPVREVPPWAKGKKMKKAAVLIPICAVDDQPSVLFTVRSSDLSHHKGEVR